MKKTKLNVKLLRKIQKHITEEPRRFFMSWFIAKADTQEEWSDLAASEDDLSKEPPPCGTAACIAGWANLLTRGPKDEVSNTARATRILGIELVDYTKTPLHPLFDSQGWPTPFARNYNKAKTPKQRAKIACQRIDHLIKYGE